MSGSVNIAHNLMNFSLYKKCIKSDRAKIIDDYFSQFGYATNIVKVPNINSRLHWNYVKTQNAKFTGNIPQKDLLEIENIFNKGVTFWKSNTNVGNYNLNNI